MRTLEEFSKLLGVKGSNISSIENGRSKMSLELAIEISKVYEVSLDWLLKGVGARDGGSGKVAEPAGEYVTIPKDELLALYKKANKNQEQEIEQLQKQVQQAHK